MTASLLKMPEITFGKKDLVITSRIQIIGEIRAQEIKEIIFLTSDVSLALNTAIMPTCVSKGVIITDSKIMRRRRETPCRAASHPVSPARKKFRYLCKHNHSTDNSLSG